jgi:hypothetical protein
MAAGIANCCAAADSTMIISEGLRDLQILTAAPAPVADPAGEALLVLNGLREVGGAIRRSATVAKRLLSVYTPYFDPDLYEDNALVECIKEFILTHSYARVRILLNERLQQAGYENKFLSMARRLTNYIEFRALSADFTAYGGIVVIADDHSVVYMPTIAKWEAIANFQQPNVARMHLREFDEVWATSLREPDRIPVAI